MRAFVLATLFVASCSASYLGAISTQFQAHDGHGGYSYGYSDPLSTKHETKDAHGITHGKYSYVDADGHIQTVKYTADPIHGFRAEGTNFPKAPESAAVAVASPYHYSAPAALHWGIPTYGYDGLPVAPSKTPEVIAAEHAHFAAVHEAKARLHHVHKRSAYGYAPLPVNGVPVDTAEVQHEKAAHFAAYHKALAAAGPIKSYHEPAYHHEPAQYYNEPAYYHEKKYQGPIHIPVIKDGVPEETPEVKAAKAKHFAAVAEVKHTGPAHYYEEPAAPVYVHQPAQYHHEPAYHHEKKYQGPIHIPVIKDGVPEETPEVKHAKAAHYHAIAEAKSHPAYSQYEESYNEKKWY